MATPDGYSTKLLLNMISNRVENSTNQTFLPKVSAIVPIYNGEADLPDLLKCLKAQTYPADCLEYLLVDNNSRDRTSTLLADIIAAQRPIEVPIRHLTEISIQSSYAARNCGIRAATGDILAFTDADCRPMPNWLETLIQPFVNPLVGIVAGEITALPGKTLLEQYADLRNILSQQHTLAHPFCPYGQTANLAIRRQAIQQVGLFRPYLTTGGDADLCWRILRQTQWQLEFAPGAIAQHRHRSTWQQLFSQWRRYGESNRYLHELHGIELMQELTEKEYIYQLTKWLLKELPVKGMKAIARQTNFADLLSTPISLFCARARAIGQREFQLSDAARQIEWL